jgi:hypothetical protein
MTFVTLKIPGTAAIETLELRRGSYHQTGEYPFLIGKEEELRRIREGAEFNDRTIDDLVRESLSLDLSNWLSERREEAEEYEFSEEDILGDWPGEVSEKGSISLHLDVLSRQIENEVLLGLAKINQPWQLPAVLKYGAWNDCPAPEVHCAFHRKWQSEFGAEIVGMSGDVIECVVKNPPRDKAAAIDLAWQQYWYCADIVEQGCESVSNLAATLIHSKYWYFWWD